MGFTQPYSGSLGDLDGNIQLIPGTYKSDGTVKSTSIDKVILKCDCIQGSIVNGVREPLFYSFALVQPPFQKILEEPQIKHLKKVKKSNLSHIRFYPEVDDHKEVDFNGETIFFTCQLIKI